MRRQILAGGAAIALGLGLTACGSSGDSDDGGYGAPKRTDDPAAKLKRDPIKIMGIEAYTLPATGFASNALQGARARVNTVNAAGGIDGRPLQLLSCNTKLDVNLSSDCARKAVREKVVAVFGFNAGNVGDSFDILQKANIAIVGTSLNDIVTGSYTNSFPFNSSISLFSAIPGLFKAAGVKKYGLIFPRAPQVKEGAARIEAASERIGQQIGGFAQAPLDAVDFAPAAATALSQDAGGVLIFFPGAKQATAMAAVRQRSPSAALGAISITLSPPIVKALGSEIDGTLVISTLLPSGERSPGTNMFNADMDEWIGSGGDRTDGPELQWLQTWVIERVLKDLDTVSSKSFLGAMNKLEDLDMGGILPPLTTTGVAADAAFPRDFVPTVTFSRYEGAELKLLDPEQPFFNPYD